MRIGRRVRRGWGLGCNDWVGSCLQRAAAISGMIIYVLYAFIGKHCSVVLHLSWLGRLLLMDNGIVLPTG